MARRVYECLTYDMATATCTEAAFVEREVFPEMAVYDAFILLSATALLFAVCWGWKRLERQTGPRG